MFSFSAPRATRHPSLTPMIDVVFLLLVFFMLASRFGQEMSLPLSTAGSGAAYSGPPRLVEISEDSVRLNGQPLAVTDLPEALGPLMSGAEDVVVLRPDDNASLQALIDVTDALRAAGLRRLVVVE